MEGEIERGGRGERGREWGREEGREGGREGGRQGGVPVQLPLRPHTCCGRWLVHFDLQSQTGVTLSGPLAQRERWRGAEGGGGGGGEERRKKREEEEEEGGGGRREEGGRCKEQKGIKLKECSTCYTT